MSDPGENDVFNRLIEKEETRQRDADIARETKAKADRVAAKAATALQNDWDQANRIIYAELMIVNKRLSAARIQMKMNSIQGNVEPDAFAVKCISFGAFSKNVDALANAVLYVKPSGQTVVFFNDGHGAELERLDLKTNSIDKSQAEEIFVKLLQYAEV